MRIRNMACVLAAAVSLAFCASCSSSGGGEKVDTSVGAQKPALSDEQIFAEVKKAFDADPVLRNESIDIAVTDGRVTLTGAVSSSEIRIKAEDTARSVPEVFGVDAEKLTVR